MRSTRREEHGGERSSERSRISVHSLRGMAHYERNNLSPPPPARKAPPPAAPRPSPEPAATKACAFRPGDVVELRAVVEKVDRFSGDNVDTLVIRLLNIDGTENDRGIYRVIDMSTAKVVKR